VKSDSIEEMPELLLHDNGEGKGIVSLERGAALIDRPAGAGL